MNPQGFIACHDGLCPICTRLIVKGKHTISKMEIPIKSDNNYYGEEREYRYAHTACYNTFKKGRESSDQS